MGLMTRARCAECGQALYIKLMADGEYSINPCNRCRDAAKQDAIDTYMEQLAEAKQLLDEGRD